MLNNPEPLQGEMGSIALHLILSDKFPKTNSPERVEPRTAPYTYDELRFLIEQEFTIYQETYMHWANAVANCIPQDYMKLVEAQIMQSGTLLALQRLSALLSSIRNIGGGFEVTFEDALIKSMEQEG